MVEYPLFWLETDLNRRSPSSIAVGPHVARLTAHLSSLFFDSHFTVSEVVNLVNALAKKLQLFLL
jgi:hypothetical protein